MANRSGNNVQKGRQEKHNGRSISVGLFVFLWLVVCVSTSIVAVRYPFHGFVRKNEDVIIPITRTNKKTVIPHRFHEHRNLGYYAYNDEPYMHDSGITRNGFGAESDGSHEEYDAGITVLIEALCRLIAGGDARHARTAFHPQQIESFKERFSLAIAFIGDEDAVVEFVISRVFCDLTSQTGTIIGVSYGVLGANRLDGTQMEAIKQEAIQYGISEVISNAYELNVRFDVEGEAGIASCERKLRVYNTCTGWFILPDEFSL